MRLLTVTQPTASVLAVPGLHGHPVVNRRFATGYRGRLVLVADALDRSVLIDPLVRSTLTDSGLDVEQLPTTGGIAVATLIDCHLSNGACCAPWGTSSSGWWHLVLDDVRPLSRRARVGGRRGIPELDAKEHAEVLTCL